MSPEQATPGTLSEVGSTALAIALARATESAREDRLFDDSLAEQFVRVASAEGAEWPQDGLREAMGDYFALRTRFFDDFLLEAAGAGCTQVVIVAAGLDTRAYRLDWPQGLRLFEVDRQDVLTIKDRVLDEHDAVPACARAVVAADVREDWTGPLRERGFDPAQPTAWLVEGLLVYLTAQECDRLMTSIAELSAPGSRIGVEHLSLPMLNTEQTRAAIESNEDTSLNKLAGLWRNDNAADPAEWVGGYGWSVRDHELLDLAERHGRPMPMAFDTRIEGMPRIALLLGSRA